MKLKQIIQEGELMAAINIYVWVFFAIGVQSTSGAPTAIFAKTITAKMGQESVNLTCDGFANYLNSQLIFNDTKIKEIPGKIQKLANGAYSIKNIQVSDAGIYYYKQSSADLTHKNHCIVELQINEETITVKPGSVVKMLCKVPHPMDTWDEVSWRRKYKSNVPQKITNNGSISQSAKKAFSGRLSAPSWSSLTISSSEESDSGKYTCVVVLKVSLQRKEYYINLVVGMPSTNMPKTSKIVTSDITSRPSSPSLPTSVVTTHKSCAVTPASRFTSCSLIALVLGYFFTLSIS